MHSGNSSFAAKHQAISFSIGIASLVLEGRVLSREDGEDFKPQQDFFAPINVKTGLESGNSLQLNCSGNTNSGSVTQRISEKLQQIRQCPGTSKEVIEATIAIPTQARDFKVTGTASLLASAAKPIIHDIVHEWNNTSLIYNGLEKFHIAFSPIKFASSYPAYSTIALKQSYNIPKIVRKKDDKKISKQGPHCEQFLKNIGVIKVEAGEDVDHLCNHISKFCCRWQFYLRQMAQILTKGEETSIEVYLGPENNAILLEQWIFTFVEKTPQTSSMTVQSLCNAIRSQLYFSQISSWVQLLKDANSDTKGVKPFSSEIMDNPRLCKNLQTMQARLDIMFRIKSYDGTACFNEKPLVHTFPDTSIADNMAIRVCMKSLPRLEKIPTLNTNKANINGFCCDNQIKAASHGGPAHLINDRIHYSSCHEKGKHRCRSDEDDDVEILCNETKACSNFKVPESGVSTPRGSPSPPPATTVAVVSPPISNLNHREKQLMKYKKRLMKREKKHKEGNNSLSSDCSEHSKDLDYSSYESPINATQAPLFKSTGQEKSRVMEEIMNSTKDDYVPSTATSTSLSIATQTDDPVHNCDTCGDQLQCWNCDNSITSLRRPSAGTNKAELLLQAIRRTGNANVRPEANCDYDNNNRISEKPTSDTKRDDCRLCKRQKTKHHYGANQLQAAPPLLPTGSYRRTMSECQVVLNESVPRPKDTLSDDITVEGIAFDEQMKKYRRAFSEDVINLLPGEALANQCDASDGSEDDECINIKCQCERELKREQMFHLEAPYKTTPNVNLQHFELPLYVKLEPNNNNNCVGYMSTASMISPHKKHILAGKTIPKINLTTIFNAHPFNNIASVEPANDSGIGLAEQDKEELPFGDNVFDFNKDTVDNAAFPPAPLVSPRFLRSSAMLKRRSRHLSDRSSFSERSSIGSDEHLSDDEAIYLQNLKSSSSSASTPSVGTPSLSTKISSLYKKFANKTESSFGRLPLLGTLEESLLKNRFTPKSIVSGFKVLLGASGSFCPTQLTIPAQTYYYEFHGRQHMATPYMCELRLSRKGYSIPRTGTVQATLLNPLGTVVRMFVIPYDFRDMPAMSQTFIRQRVLACDESSSVKNVDQLSTAEQMKYLRYAIHLRFQTSRSGRLCLHTDIKLLISRRPDCDTAAAHAKNSLESPNDLKTVTIIPDQPKFSDR